MPFFIPLLLTGGVVYAGYRAYQRLVDDQPPVDKAVERDGKPPSPALERARQFHSLVNQTTSQEVVEMERETRHFLKLSFANSGLATATLLLMPAYTAISVPLTLYTSLPVFVDAYRSLRSRKLRIAVLDAVAITIDLAAGYYVLSAYTATIYFVAIRLLDRTRNRNRKNISNIFQELPQSAWVKRNGVEVEQPIRELQPGDIVIVNAGDLIPVDGQVVAGAGAVDQRMLTGESQQAEIVSGDQVMAATLLVSGRIEIETCRAGSDTLAVHITETLSQTSEYELALLTRTEDAVNRTVAPMLGLGAFTLAALGPVSTMAVMGSNFAEVLRVTGPISMINFLELASSDSILIKDARTLESLTEVDTVVFDKTGTLTLDQPQLGAIHPLADLDETSLLRLAAAAEQFQRHPIARAIVDCARERGIELPSIDNGHYEVGFGLRVTIDGRQIEVGSRRFIEMEQIDLPDTAMQLETLAHANGHSVIHIAVDRHPVGLLELEPAIRPEVENEVARLKARGLDLYIISGDQEAPTRHLAERLGIERYHANTLPNEKATLIDQLQQQGRKVCYVGDGINDAIALKRAAVSVSLRGASSVATDTAQIILMDQSLAHLDELFALASEFHANQRAGIISTVTPGIIAIGGIYLFHFGILSTMILFNVSLLAGLGTATLPRLKRSIREQSGAQKPQWIKTKS
jgi:heavy metal translocating P-type ATPase